MMSRSTNVRRARLKRIALTLASLLLSPWYVAAAQGLVTPVAHWGGLMLPERDPSTTWSFHTAVFTQFGKETTSTGAYLFRPYNDIDQTIGFNIVSRSQQKYLHSAGMTGSSISQRRTYSLGVEDDHLTAFFQNQVIHLGNLRGKSKLRPVPRHIGDTPDKITVDPFKWNRTPIVGFADEYFLRMYYSQQEQGVEERVLSPLFIGGGYEFGTINQEMFVHVGSDVLERDVKWEIKHVGIRSLGVGGMMRAGILAPGPWMRDLTADYLTAQGVLRVVLDIRDYPIRVDYGVTAARGYFVAPRSLQQRAENGDFGTDTQDAKHYQTKTPLTERFSTFRVSAGNLVFEAYNDSFGGKDKGPSFGAQVSFRFAPAMGDRP